MARYEGAFRLDRAEADDDGDDGQERGREKLQTLEPWDEGGFWFNFVPSPPASP